MARHRGFDDDTVIDRAMDEFWTKGYANTSPAQLAEATGIAKGSLYNAFGSKRELFEQALRRYDVLGIEFTEKLLSEPGNTREAIGSFLRFLVDADVAQEIRRGCLAVNTAVEFAGHDPEMVRTVRTIQDHTIASLAARIDRGRRDGDIAADTDPQATAQFLMNTIVGLRVMAKTHDGPTLHRIIESALAVL
jgi:TetR/AcrR family transcriptional repressor of nem operon